MNEDAVRAIESALAKAVLNKPALFYRGLRGKYSDLIRKFLLNGCDVIEPRTFQSVFTQQAIAHDSARCDEGSAVVLAIRTPAGMHMIALDQFEGGLGFHEYEIILPRSIIYMVNSLYRSGGKIYADVTAESPDTTPPSDDLPSPKRTPRKVFTRDEALANPVNLDSLLSDPRPKTGPKPVGQEPIEGYIQIGPRQYIQAYAGPILDRRFTKGEIFANSFTLGQFLDVGRTYSSGQEAELGSLMIYKRDADGYYVMVYPQPEIEPGDFESPASWA